MLTRRTLLTGGAVAGAAAGATGGAAGAAQSSRSADTDERMARALEEIRDLLRGDSGGNCPELTTIRALQREFLKGHGKFPDFIEVGIDVWDSLTNWHVRTRQPVQVTRMGDGRYAMAVLLTNIVLRHDAANAYVGQGFDSK